MKDKNHILEGCEITKMISKQQSRLNIEYEEEQNEQCSDINWVAKIETRKLDFITIMSSGRIEQKKMKSILRKKYEQIEINQ